MAIHGPILNKIVGLLHKPPRPVFLLCPCVAPPRVFQDTQRPSRRPGVSLWSEIPGIEVTMRQWQRQRPPYHTRGVHCYSPTKPQLALKATQPKGAFNSGPCWMPPPWFAAAPGRAPSAGMAPQWVVMGLRAGLEHNPRLTRHPNPA